MPCTSSKFEKFPPTPLYAIWAAPGFDPGVRRLRAHRADHLAVPGLSVFRSRGSGAGEGDRELSIDPGTSRSPCHAPNGQAVAWPQSHPPFAMALPGFDPGRRRLQARRASHWAVPSLAGFRSRVAPRLRAFARAYVCTCVCVCVCVCVCSSGVVGLSPLTGRWSPNTTLSSSWQREHAKRHNQKMNANLNP